MIEREGAAWKNFVCFEVIRSELSLFCFDFGFGFGFFCFWGSGIVR